MLAFHNEPALKAYYQARLAAHYAANDIIRGEYGGPGGVSGWRGCAVGGTLHSSDPKVAETELGIPEVVMRLDDIIFESLPESEGPQWAVDFLSAIPVGADLALVGAKFAMWVLSDPVHGSRQYADAASKVMTDAVLHLYNRWLTGDEPSQKEWQDASVEAIGGYKRAAHASYVTSAVWTTANREQAARLSQAADIKFSNAHAAGATAFAAHPRTNIADALTDGAYAARLMGDTAYWQAAKERLLQLLKGSLS